MQRDAYTQLISWKNNPERKPLVVQGARQVGKTWLIREFGTHEFKAMAYISFIDNEILKQVFELDLDVERIISALSIYTGVSVGDPDVLLVFDEIQECPRAITSLKPFCEQRPDIPLIAAGSLLGVAHHQGINWPVGKIQYLDLFPMSFTEFLRGTGNERYAGLISSNDYLLINTFHHQLVELFRYYYVIGGMPEAVQAYASTQNLEQVRDVQLRLLRDYQNDFSKHASPDQVEKIRMIWQSIPAQIARENKKFIYSAIRDGARARGYEEAIQWLVDAGLVLKVERITKPGLPLSAYGDRSAFKLYLLDVGLLGAYCGLDIQTILQGNELFSEFKGALTENYVCQTLTCIQHTAPYYWSAEKANGEIDFIIQKHNLVVPIEVKAEENLKAKSLKSFADKFHIEKSLRTSLSPYRQQDWMDNIPLYCAHKLAE